MPLTAVGGAFSLVFEFKFPKNLLVGDRIHL